MFFVSSKRWKLLVDCNHGQKRTIKFRSYKAVPSLKSVQDSFIEWLGILKLIVYFQRNKISNSKILCVNFQQRIKKKLGTSQNCHLFMNLAAEIYLTVDSIHGHTLSATIFLYFYFGHTWKYKIQHLNKFSFFFKLDTGWMTCHVQVGCRMHTKYIGLIRFANYVEDYKVYSVKRQFVNRLRDNVPTGGDNQTSANLQRQVLLSYELENRHCPTFHCDYFKKFTYNVLTSQHFNISQLC